MQDWFYHFQNRQKEDSMFSFEFLPINYLVLEVQKIYQYFYRHDLRRFFYIIHQYYSSLQIFTTVLSKFGLSRSSLMSVHPLEATKAATFFLVGFNVDESASITISLIVNSPFSME